MSVADVAHRLREARAESGLGYQALADRAGIPHRQTVYAIEAGEQSASVEQIERLAAALGVTPEWLAFGKQ